MMGRSGDSSWALLGSAFVGRLILTDKGSLLSSAPGSKKAATRDSQSTCWHRSESSVPHARKTTGFHAEIGKERKSEGGDGGESGWRGKGTLTGGEKMTSLRNHQCTGR